MAKSIRSKTKRFYRSVKRDNMQESEAAKIAARNEILAAALAAQEEEVRARREASRAERAAALAAQRPESRERAKRREDERARMVVGEASEADFPNGKPYGRNAIKRMIKGKRNQKHARSRSKSRVRSFHKATRPGK